MTPLSRPVRGVSVPVRAQQEHLNRVLGQYVVAESEPILRAFEHLLWECECRLSDLYARLQRLPATHAPPEQQTVRQSQLRYHTEWWVRKFQKEKSRLLDRQHRLLSGGQVGP